MKAQTGAVPYLGCGGEHGTILEEVWYFNHVLGTVSSIHFIRVLVPDASFAQEQFGQFKTLDSTTKSSCNTTHGIWYYERTPTSERDVRTLPGGFF